VVKVDKANFGRKIRHLRELRKLSVNELGRRIGRNGAMVSRLENGKIAQPGADVVAALSRVLAVDPIYFMDDNVESVFAVFETANMDLPEDISKWLMSHDSLDWVELAKECSLANITPEVARDVLRAIIKAREMDGQNSSK
jgi:transcriptional regulator with XRE-family HTH domain